VKTNQRPVYLNLFTMKFPPAAIASILHRLSGVVLFLFIPLMLWGLAQSLASANTFQGLQDFFTAPLMKVTLWLVLVSLVYHLLAGIRHLLMDVHLADSRLAGKITALLTFGVVAVIAILIGMWLW